MHGVLRNAQLWLGIFHEVGELLSQCERALASLARQALSLAW